MLTTIWFTLLIIMVCGTVAELLSSSVDYEFRTFLTVLGIVTVILSPFAAYFRH